MYSQQLQVIFPGRRIAPWSNAYTAQKLGAAANNPAMRAAEREEDMEREALDSNKSFQTQSLALESAGQQAVNKLLNQQLGITSAGSDASDTAGKIGLGITGAKALWDIGSNYDKIGKMGSDLASAAQTGFNKVSGLISPPTNVASAEEVAAYDTPAGSIAEEDELARLVAELSGWENWNFMDNIIQNVPDLPLGDMWSSLIA